MNLPSQNSTQTSAIQNGQPRSTTQPNTPNHNPVPDATTPTVSTSVAMTVTPASAAASVTSSSSTRSSPRTQLHAIKTQTMPKQDHAYSPSPQSFTSPSPSTMPSATSDRTFSDRSPSPQARPAFPSAMAEAISASKSPGLIRRLSRGAHQKLRRKTSHHHSLRMRDQSAGPVLMRRRSDSNGASDLAQDMSDLELDPSTERIFDDMPYQIPITGVHNGLGIKVGRPSDDSTYFVGGIAPAISAVLQAGTWVTKHTNKNKKIKRIKMWLDPNSARVCWHPTNANKSFFIDDIRNVRVGVESRNARDDVQIPKEQEDRFVSVVYEPPERSKGRTIKTMHVVMDSDVIVKCWTDALSTVTRERVEMMNALATSPEKSDKSMAMAWKLAMARKAAGVPQVLTLDDARWLCRKMEINCSDHAVRTHFTWSDPSHTGSLDYAHYRDFVNSFKERKDIQNLFRNLNCGTGLDLDLEAFLMFVKKDQGADVDKDRAHWESVFEKFAKASHNRAALPDAEPVAEYRAINMHGLQNFLTSGFNSPLISTRGEVTVLDRPLNEYFISSSHNTYLLGLQVRGTSSVEGYIAALIRGCRCVEIDCWDGDEGRPVVTHGRTMTSKVPFQDCVSTIAKYAFHSSPYPLIVSLEVHCSPEQQKAMVDIMKKHWSGVMVTEPITTNAVSLPSPEELKGKILVKVKAAQDKDESEHGQLLVDTVNGRSRARSLGSAFVRTPSTENNRFMPTSSFPSPPLTSPSETNVTLVSTPHGSTTSGPTLTPSSSADDTDDNPISPEPPRKRKTSKIVSELGRLGVYAQGIKFGGFTLPEAKVTNHIFSFSESMFNKLCLAKTDSKALLEKHNLRYLMRVYPKASRYDSSNFNPMQAWRRGVQMAALNWQTFDVNQQVNEAMFAAGNDRLGYVLKPEELRHAKHVPIADMIPEPAEKKDKKGKKIVKFSVDIISAQRLPRPPGQNNDYSMNPYIEFEMYSAEDKAQGIAHGEGGYDLSARDGSSGIGSPLRKRTKIIEGNGFDPIFSQVLSMSATTKFSSLIFVRWTVWNAPEGRPGSSNNVLLATFTAKLDSLQQGYRHLPLFNPQGEQYRDAKLFVKIKKEAPVAVAQENNAYGIMEPNGSPRPDTYRADRSWRSRVFSRTSSQRRRPDQTDEIAGIISRTASTDRESLR